jgi:hypothetical protein
MEGRLSRKVALLLQNRLVLQILCSVKRSPYETFLVVLSVFQCSFKSFSV